MPQLASPFYEALQSKGIKAPLDLPEHEGRLHAAIAQANGIPTEESFEWLAGKFDMLPFRPSRASLPGAAENVFRELGAEWNPEDDQPWLPVGSVGPLLIVGHFNPAITATWAIAECFLIRVLLEETQYWEYYEDLTQRMQARPLRGKKPIVPSCPLEKGGTPETALKWLLQEYPFKVDERQKLNEALAGISGVSAAHILQSKALPEGYGAALRRLCTGDQVFNPTLAPRQTAFPDALLEKHAVFPLFCGVRTVFMLSSHKELFGFEDEWLSANSDPRDFRAILADKESIVRVVNRDRSNAAAAGGDTMVGEMVESEAGNIVEIDTEDINRVNPASINTTAEQALQWVLYRSITARASDLHIEKYFNMARFRSRIDGELVTLFSAPEEMLPRYISLIKNYSNMGQERQAAQDGRFSLRLGKRRVDCRVSAIPCRKDQQKVTIRYLDKADGVRKLGELNLSKRNLELLQAAMSRDQGLILITGPTGSGKTTTLYALLNSVNAENLNIQTIEDPIEYEIEGLNQTQTDPVHSIDFAQGLRRLMRADPDIILIGECRDEETASAAVNAALTGHLVLTTLHANDCLRAVSRFISMGVPPYLLADSLALTQAQRLVRKLCGQCKQMIAITPEQKALFAANGIPLPREVTHLYEAQGCPECRETGYRGRIALMELCPVGRDLADLISLNAPQGEMRKIATSQGLRTLYQEGLQAVLDGNTSLEEIKCLSYTGISVDDAANGESQSQLDI
ncbi:MAG: type II/IV secretion system protein [Chthoniobacterales bacterium]|nr:type II/IV secretion system protein [Chthoniobacterales bacterium]